MKLDRLGLLTELDALALEVLTEQYAEVVELRADVQKHGFYKRVKTKAGGFMERARPAAVQLADAERRFRATLAEFGMTPSARSRVSAVVPEHNDDDSFLFGGIANG